MTDSIKRGLEAAGVKMVDQSKANFRSNEFFTAPQSVALPVLVALDKQPIGEGPVLSAVCITLEDLVVIILVLSAKPDGFSAIEVAKAHCLKEDADGSSLAKKYNYSAKVIGSVLQPEIEQ